MTGKKDAAMNKKAAQPTSGEDTGYYVKVTYTQYGIELSPTETLLKEVAEESAEGYEFAPSQSLNNIWELMEDFFTNGWEEVRPEDVGALTDGELFADPNGNVYWHERYQIEDMVDELRKGNTVSMQYGGNLFDEQESEINEEAKAREEHMSSEKQATGEMTQSEADNREEWPLHHTIADALGGKVKAFDQYSGPYVLIGSEVRGQGVYAPAIPMKGTVRLWIQMVEGAEGLVQVYNEDSKKLSEPFPWDDTVAAVEAAKQTFESTPDSIEAVDHTKEAKAQDEHQSSAKEAARKCPECGGDTETDSELDLIYCENAECDWNDKAAVEKQSAVEKTAMPPKPGREVKDKHGWTGRLRSNYDNDFEQFKGYDEVYNIAQRLGFDTPEAAWEANPKVYGSVYPEDLHVVGAVEKESSSDEAKYGHGFDNHPLIDMLWDYLQADVVDGHYDRVNTGWGTKTKQGLVLSIARALKESPVSGKESSKK